MILELETEQFELYDLPSLIYERIFHVRFVSLDS